VNQSLSLVALCANRVWPGSVRMHGMYYFNRNGPVGVVELQRG